MVEHWLVWLNLIWFLWDYLFFVFLQVSGIDHNRTLRKDDHSTICAKSALHNRWAGDRDPRMKQKAGVLCITSSQWLW